MILKIVAAGNLQRTGPLERARAALARHEWAAALHAYEEAGPAQQLDAQDLEGIAWAAAWTGDLARGIESWEQAYQRHVDAGRRGKAGVAAFWVGWWYEDRGLPAVAAGWRHKLEQAAREAPKGAGRGYACLVRGWRSFGAGDLEAARAAGTRALEAGERVGDHDLAAFATIHLAQVDVAAGEPDRGTSLADQAAAAVLAGELSPGGTFVVYCSLIGLCFAIADLKRAGDWTDALGGWCDRQGIRGFPGVCRVGRSKILRLRGRWADAEAEAVRARRELEAFAPGLAGPAFYELGELRLRLGDLEGAASALKQAHGLGVSPHPAWALLLLARGEAAAAAGSIAAALEAAGWYPTGRAPLLPAYVEIALAAGDVASARAAADELATLGRMFGSTAHDAAGAMAQGAVALADADPAARGLLERARSLWQELGLPYETARTRVLLAQACHLQGDDAACRLEVEAALAEFERLGAGADAEALHRGQTPAATRAGRRMEIRMLGPFRVTVDGERVPSAAWQPRPAELVQLLALSPGHRLHRERVMEALWPETPPDEAGANLHRVAHRARRALGHPGGLVLRGGTVSLLPDGLVRTDVEDFEAAAAEALRHGAEACAALLDAYPGELLADNPYPAWAQERIDAVARLRRAVLSAAGRWRELAADDPYDEEAARHSMAELAAAGDRRAALQLFEQLRDRLARELGVEPEPATTALAAAVRGPGPGRFPGGS